MCSEIGFPVSIDKTVWATNRMTFLGLLIDTIRRIVLIPIDKIDKAKVRISDVLNKKRITLLQLQRLCGLLNFLCKCVVAGRAFTRRLYCAGVGVTNQSHHLNVTRELKLDLRVWLCFLNQPDVFCRPFIDFGMITPYTTDFHTDASGNIDLGAGGHCGAEWFVLSWDPYYFAEHHPSIDYLELYALTVGVKLWLKNFRNRSIAIYCDNLGVVHMINNSSSNCPKCMVLIRIVVLECMENNTSLTALHVRTKMNVFADLLSRSRGMTCSEEKPEHVVDTLQDGHFRFRSICGQWVNFCPISELQSVESGVPVGNGLKTLIAVVPAIRPNSQLSFLLTSSSRSNVNIIVRPPTTPTWVCGEILINLLLHWTVYLRPGKNAFQFIVHSW